MTQLRALGALLVLTAASFALSHAALGSFELWVGLGIAAAKAWLIAVYFLRVRLQRASSQLSMAVAVALVVILLALAVVDILARPLTAG